MRRLLLTLVLCHLTGLAAAQTIWRCGPDGRSFSDTPCTEGHALPLAETRPAEDVSVARARAERDIRLAEQLRRERLAEEAAQRGNGLASLGPVTAAAPKPVRPTANIKRPQGEARSPQRAQRPAGPAARGTSRAVAPSSRHKTD